MNIELLGEIFEGWKNFIFKNKEHEELATKRIKSCLGCPEFKATTKRCGICGCFMPAKVRVEQAKCPIGKW